MLDVAYFYECSQSCVLPFNVAHLPSCRGNTLTEGNMGGSYARIDTEGETRSALTRREDEFHKGREEVEKAKENNPFKVQSSTYVEAEDMMPYSGHVNWKLWSEGDGYAAAKRSGQETCCERANSMNSHFGIERSSAPSGTS